MCGRFSLFVDPSRIEERFEIFNIDDIDIIPRYNIAPSQDIAAIIRSDEGNKAGFLRWGLVPVWAKDPKIGYKMINARAETVDEKPAYKRLLKRRRCIIPASGFFEWQKRGSKKHPHHIQMKNDDVFSFAGLWDRSEIDGMEIQSCTIITTTPNDLMKDIHNRMPVILNKENEQAWLDRTNDDTEYLKSLLQPYDTEQMEAYEVSKEVGSPKNNHEGLVERI
jgi:putative SOS response-associated peptidase YedK